MVYRRWRAWMSWLWPGQCMLCRASIAAGEDICNGCRADLPWIKNSCPTCAAPSGSAAMCGRCQRKKPPTDHACAALRYEAPIDRLIVRLKYRGKLDLSRTLGELLVSKIRGTDRYPDILVPVPLHSSRMRQRGYNQALEIARVVAHRLQLPLAHDAVRRTRATATQTALPLSERARNVRNAFAVRSNAMGGKHVAIVDDVMTSGHTINALAKTLRKAGARKITAWVVARA